MKKNTFTNKDIIFLVIACIVFYLLKAILPLLIILGIYLFIRKRFTAKIDQKPHRRPIEQQDNFDNEIFKANLAECEDVINEEQQLRQEADLRQFQGRTDVTKEELATYMFEQRRWDGIYERHVHMEEIIKVCNLNPEDITWVENELQHYHEGDATYDNKCSYIRSEEDRIITEYQNEKTLARLQTEVPRNEQEFQKNLSFMQEIGLDEVIPSYQAEHQKLMSEYEKTIRECDYNLWLSMKGYVKNEQNI